MVTKSIKDAAVKIELLQKAKEDSFTEFTGYGLLRKYKKGSHVFLDHEDVCYFYFMVSGIASLYKLNSLGEKKVIFIFNRGSLLNEIMVQDLPSSINCEILQDAELLCFPKDKFLATMSQDFELSKAVMESMALKIRRLYRQLKNTTNSMSGVKKIAAKLWKLSMDYGIENPNGAEIDLEISITYLADMLGSKRETVSRQLKVLADQGLVIVEKNKFVIPDRESLMIFFKQP